MTERKIFGLLRSQDTTTGDDRYREDIILASMDGGADAVSAINGASISALSPPISLKDFLKLSPLLSYKT